MFTEAQTAALVQICKTSPTVARAIFDAVLAQPMSTEERDRVEILRAYFTDAACRAALEEMTWQRNRTA